MFTPLIRVSKVGHMEAVRILQSAGAYKSKADNYSWAPSAPPMIEPLENHWAASVSTVGLTSMTLHYSAIVTVTSIKKPFFPPFPSHLVQIEDGAGAALGYASREHFFFSLKGLDGCFADIPQASAHHLAKLFFLPINVLLSRFSHHRRRKHEGTALPKAFL